MSHFLGFVKVAYFSKKVYQHQIHQKPDSSIPKYGKSGRTMLFRQGISSPPGESCKNLTKSPSFFPILHVAMKMGTNKNKKAGLAFRNEIDDPKKTSKTHAKQ
jgi:hypothetical protein